MPSGAHSKPFPSGAPIAAFNGNNCLKTQPPSQFKPHLFLRHNRWAYIKEHSHERWCGALLPTARQVAGPSPRTARAAHGCCRAPLSVETGQDMFTTPLYQQHASHTLASRACGPQPHMRIRTDLGHGSLSVGERELIVAHVEYLAEVREEERRPRREVPAELQTPTNCYESSRIGGREKEAGGLIADRGCFTCPPAP